MQTDNKKLAEKSTRSTELCEIAMEVKFYTDNGSKKHNRILCLLQHRNDKSQYALMFLKNRRFQSHFVDGVIPIFADFKQRLFVKGKAQDLKFDLLMMNGEIVNFEAICEWEMLNRFLDDLNSAAQSAIDHDHTLEFGTSHQWLVPYVKARDKSATELTKDLFLSSDLVESPRFSAGNSLNTTKTSFIDFSFEDDDLIGYGSPSSSTTTTTSSTTLVRNKSRSDTVSASVLATGGRNIKEIWLKNRMKTREDEFIQYQTFNVYCATWNVNMKKPKEELDDWLHDPCFPDIYAIGFQEIDMSAEAFVLSDTSKTEPWENAIEESLLYKNYDNPPKYTKLACTLDNPMIGVTLELC